METQSARARIRQWRADHDRRLAVLDDDPTGSQSVHGVQVVTVFEEAEYAAALADPGSVAFVLTNTRGMSEVDAVSLNREVVAGLLAATGGGKGLDLLSRSDSTLRGHVLAEVRAIDEVVRESTGRGYDGVLLAPSFFEAGRFTAGDIHWARIAGQPVPVGETEFARDATFGYSASDLRDFVAEKSGGTISRDDVLSIPLETIRGDGPDGVRDILLRARDLAFVVVNAESYDDLETVVLGVQAAEDAGRRFLHRSGPSFVRALAGLEPRDPLLPSDLPGLGGGHGLVVVGSHVSQTSRQVAVARASGGLVEVELNVPDLIGDEQTRAASISDAIAIVADSLASDDVLLYTSRDFVPGDDPATSLRIARLVSSAVTEVVSGALPARPAWVVAKGGITSHTVAVNGLGIRRARVLGQLLPGIISLLDPLVAAPEVVGVPYVVFAGNVGDDDTLAHVISILRAAQPQEE